MQLMRERLVTVAASLEPASLAIRAAVVAPAAHFCLGLGFVDRELPAIEIGAVHLFRRELALGVGAERHERETARAARLTVVGDVNVSHAAELTEGVAEIGLGGLEGHVSNIEFGI